MRLTSEAKRRARRWRRKLRRGRMLPAEATALSTRSRRWWPVMRSVTRWHRYPRRWYEE